MTRTGAALLVALATLGGNACGKVYDDTASPATARAARPGTASTAEPTHTTASSVTTGLAAVTATSQPPAATTQAPATTAEGPTTTTQAATTTTGQGPGIGIVPADAVATDAPGVWEHGGTYYGTCQAIQASPYADRPSLCSD